LKDRFIGILITDDSLARKRLYREELVLEISWRIVPVRANREVSINPRLTSDEQRYELGMKNFKIDFSVFVDWYVDRYNENKWFKDNALITLSTKQSDGTSA
jgi:hypothetical protein